MEAQPSGEMTEDELVKDRYDKFRKLGVFTGR